MLFQSFINKTKNRLLNKKLLSMKQNQVLRTNLPIRSSFVKNASKYLTDVKKIESKVIYSIDFTQDALMVTSRNGLVIYSLITFKMIFSIEGSFWDAAFIPDTNFIAYAKRNSNDQETNTVKIFDLTRNREIGKIKIKSSIETIKAGKKYIAMASFKDISIIQFPNLRPLYYGRAGDMVNLVYDISQKGLILAHSIDNIGEVIIHNFTRLQPAPQQIQRGSSTVRRPTQQNRFAKFIHPSEKYVLKIQALKSQQIGIIKVSPCGGRVAVTGKKGHHIKIFESTTGNIWQNLTIQTEIKILDMCFESDGRILSCITEERIAMIYNVQYDTYDESQYHNRSKYPLYQSQNPKYLLNFISNLYQRFGYDRPFATYKCKLPEEQLQTKPKQKKQQDQPLSIVLQLEQQQQLKKKIHKKQSIHNFKTSSIRNRAKTLTKLKSSSMSQIRSQNKHQVNQKYVSTVYNTVNRVFIINHYVYAVIGYHLYALKFDPFNGGEMLAITDIVID